MFRKLQLIIVVVLLVTLAGCQLVRQSAIDISKEEVKNLETCREIAVNYLSIWPMQSGFIRGALGSRIDELPTQAVDAMDELDLLAAEAQDQSDYELGLSLGLRVRLLSSIVMQVLKQYAPDVIELLPIVL